MDSYKNQSRFYKIFNFILDLIFPKECAGCRKEGVFLCPECLQKIELLNIQTCPICEKANETGAICGICKKSHYIDGLSAAIDYNNPIIRAAIKTFKFKFVEELHIPLADLIIKSVEDLPSSGRRGLRGGVQFDLIVPVPLHKKRLAWRGFNQSELIASKLSEHFKIPISRDYLIRAKNTAPQSKTKNQKEREENIKDAFDLPFFGRRFSLSKGEIKRGCVRSGSSYPQIKNKNILLVDDVCSTASTLDECARVLKNAGAKKVWGCVAARGK